MDSEWIPGMFAVIDEHGDAVFEHLVGEIPLIINAPHAGSRHVAPTGSGRYGSRHEDPSPPANPFSIGRFNTQDDRNTRHIAFGIIRRLITFGFRPYALSNRVQRQHVDLARPWELQHLWISENDVTTRPDDIDANDPIFRQTYYDAYHMALTNMVHSIHNVGGWLFDIHGQPDPDGYQNTVVLSTTRGWMARHDYLYAAGAASFHHCLNMENFVPFPLNGEVTGESDAVNYIPGYLHGATPPELLPPRPRPAYASAVVPSADRIHGVHVELGLSLRIPPDTMSREDQIYWVEEVGARLANAIYAFLNQHQFFEPTRKIVNAKERCADETWYVLNS